nr:MAG TPA: hypothetical protein [Caudoviricetes sp.]
MCYYIVLRICAIAFPWYGYSISRILYNVNTNFAYLGEKQFINLSIFFIGFAQEV